MSQSARKASLLPSPAPSLALNAAEAKRRLSELLGRVAYGGVTVLITRRGRPMARLVPVTDPGIASRLADVEGWLGDDDPFFAAVDEITGARERHLPRRLGGTKAARTRGGAR
ncbi:MAG: type II toxin-antitoxin system Phd/YefM family antitoxin [Deltaproteobacteria bacterium]|nr:type II toxin-antitoxin system Phd/YefM family antitoxin [Deltaproteobacteria bacterium]